jgi:hypothetical protein
MTDVIEMLADANPVSEDDLSPSFETVWRELDHSAPPQRRRMLSHRPFILGSATATLAAAGVVIVLVSAGSTPTAAQAFPILAKKATPSGFGAGYAFPEPYGTGYVVQDSDGSTLCVVVPPPSSAPTSSLFACAATESLEQQGGVILFSGPTGSPNAYLALVPTGGSLTVTANGTSTAQPVVDGLATGTISQSEALTVQVADQTTVEQVAPDTPTAQFTPVPADATVFRYVAVGGNSAVALNGPTGTSGATGPAPTK